MCYVLCVSFVLFVCLFVLYNCIVCHDPDNGKASKINGLKLENKPEPSKRHEQLNLSITITLNPNNKDIAQSHAMKSTKKQRD